jgi:hypothetical protein
MPITRIDQTGLSDPLSLTAPTFTTAQVSGNQTVGGTHTVSGVINAANNIVLTQASTGNSAIDIPITYNNDTTSNRARFTGTNMKHLGFFQHRDGAQFLHIRTNIADNNIMYMFHVMGYLYNQGNVVAWSSGYTFTPPTTILNQFNTSASSGATVATYRTAGPSTGGFLCLRVNRNTSSYSEGQLSIFFHSHSTGVQNASAVTAWAQNNDGGNFFAS